MKHVLIERIAAYPYHYHIHVMNGSEYAGDGAFCRTLAEVAEFMNARQITKYRYTPQALSIFAPIPTLSLSSAIPCWICRIGVKIVLLVLCGASFLNPSAVGNSKLTLIRSAR